MKQDNLRTVKKLVHGDWKSCHMKFLKIDDVFKMFEPNGVPAHEGKMWMVLNKPHFKNGVWGVSCEPIVGVYEI